MTLHFPGPSFHGAFFPVSSPVMQVSRLKTFNNRKIMRNLIFMVVPYRIVYQKQLLHWRRTRRLNCGVACRRRITISHTSERRNKQSNMLKPACPAPYLRTLYVMHVDCRTSRICNVTVRVILDGKKDCKRASKSVISALCWLLDQWPCSWGTYSCAPDDRRPVKPCK